MGLSKNMRTLRSPKSQAEFSEELGIAKATIHAIEARRSSVRLDTPEVICDNLGIPPQEILSDGTDTTELGMRPMCCTEQNSF